MMKHSILTKLRFILLFILVGTLLQSCSSDEEPDRTDEINDVASVNKTIETIRRIVITKETNLTVKEHNSVSNVFEVKLSDNSILKIESIPVLENAPILIASMVDGKYYWSIFSRETDKFEYIEGSDGKNIAVSEVKPITKIENSRWYISVNNGADWRELFSFEKSNIHSNKCFSVDLESLGAITITHYGNRYTKFKIPFELKAPTLKDNNDRYIKANDTKYIELETEINFSKIDVTDVPYGFTVSYDFSLNTIILKSGSVLTVKDEVAVNMTASSGQKYDLSIRLIPEVGEKVYVMKVSNPSSLSDFEFIGVAYKRGYVMNKNEDKKVRFVKKSGLGFVRNLDSEMQKITFSDNGKTNSESIRRLAILGFHFFEPYYKASYSSTQLPFYLPSEKELSDLIGAYKTNIISLEKSLEEGGGTAMSRSEYYYSSNLYLSNSFLIYKALLFSPSGLGYKSASIYDNSLFNVRSIYKIND